MNLYGLLLLGLASIFVGVVLAQEKPIFITCGSNSSVLLDGRNWVGDVSPGENFTLSSQGIVASTHGGGDASESNYKDLYRTARIFNTTSSYNFTISYGYYLVRLHFYPFSSFSDFNANDSSFDVAANDLKLLSKLNVPKEILLKGSTRNLTVTSLVMEYILNVSSIGLAIEFTPDPGSFAFVNAIELIPVLDRLFFGSVNRVGGDGSRSPLIYSGMETMYRLNMGVSDTESSEDTDLWRNWNSDERYMFSLDAAETISNSSIISYASMNDSSVAPLFVYETARITTTNQVMEKRFNMSWKFNVDPDFDYLIRLHFCELFYDSPNQRVFRIYINNKTATQNYDVFGQAGGKNKAYHEDYIDTATEQISSLWIQLGPDPSTSASDTDALLNGLEIFKLSRDGNLAHVSEKIDPSEIRSSSSKKPKSMLLSVSIGVAGVALVTICIVCIASICFYIRKRKRKDTHEKSSPPGWRPLALHGTIGSTTNARTSNLLFTGNGSVATTSRIGRMFTLAEIRAATNSFDESLVIGNGGFGKVYKGEMDDGTHVAVKRANPQSEQGLTEFETEIEMLSKLRHRHLVSMIGYCDEKNEMILVYEYMANGTLRSHLFGSDLPPLTWKQRLEVCIGSARGLHHLHTGEERGIIHRDVKTTNILLDEDFVAKVADFGLSKTGPALDRTHVSTAVKGSFGYLDPEYFRRQHLTQKSDVYSFGVVLFEVVCARPVIDPSLPRDEINLAEWAVRWQRQQSLETIVDPQLEGNYSLESLKKLGDIAEKCLADEGKNRPTMAEVLWHLEYVLQLHEAYMRSGDVESFTRTELRFADTSPNLPHIEEGADTEEEAIASPNKNSVNPKGEGS